MKRVIVLLLIHLPRKDERLSWPSWLTYSGRFTHIVVTRRLQAEDRTGSVRRPKTGVLPTVLTNQPDVSDVSQSSELFISNKTVIVAMFQSKRRMAINSSNLGHVCNSLFTTKLSRSWY